MKLPREIVEAELEKQKSFFEQMFLQSATSTQILDKDGWCLRINPKLSELFGVKPEHIEGHVYNIFRDEEIIRNGIDKTLAKVFNEKQTASWEVYFDIGIASESQAIEVEKKKKVWYSNKAYPIVDTSGELLYVIIQHEDISERKRAEETLRYNEKKYRLLFENNPLPMWIYGLKDLKFLEVNNAAINKYGYSREEFLNMTLKDIRPEHDIPALLEDVANTHSDYNMAGSWRHIKKNGEIIYVDIISHTIDFEGKEARLVLSNDITERIKIHEELIRAKSEAEKSDRLKSEFLAQMSHEIRSPINTMLNFVSLIKEEVLQPLTEEIKFSFNAIDSSSRRLIRTIDLILNMSQVQTGYLECNYKPLNLEKDVLSNIVNEYSTSAAIKRLSLNFVNDYGTAVVNADLYSLTQIFSNLIDNAIKYTKAGSITARIYPGREKEICVDISDTGIGISEQYIDKLFSPFTQEEQGYTRKFEGNGLGLALVKKYCELNNASISVKSSKGNGSVFTVTFGQD